MFNAYDLRLAWHSIRRNPGLSLLMVGAIALGIAVCTITFTMYHAIARNPIESKSRQLYSVTMDTWDPQRPANDDAPEMPPAQLTYRDATALYTARVAQHAVIMYKSGAVVDAGRPNVKPESALLRLTTNEFFPMFDVPFQYGDGWSNNADEGPEPVVVLNDELNQKLFGGENSVGRAVSIAGKPFRVIGVLKPWRPSPKFYDLNNGVLDDVEDAFIPFRWGQSLELSSYGNTNCWKSEVIDTYESFLNSECVWIQMWVELPTLAARDKFQAYLDNYARAQKAAGRYPRPLNNRLFDVQHWLDYNKVVQKDNSVLIGIALLFLGVCIVNVVGLLLAKFLNNAALTGLRRALGASRRDVVRQHLAEVTMLGLAGGVLGLLLGVIGLIGIRSLYDFEYTREAYEKLTTIDLPVALATLALALLAGAVAGLYPAWRIGRTAPAAYLKTQ
jgi:putative ABC transport system permease protein